MSFEAEVLTLDLDLLDPFGEITGWIISLQIFSTVMLRMYLGLEREVR